MPSLNLGEQLRSAIKPAQNTLFELLRGITREQQQTNLLLGQLVRATGKTPITLTIPPPHWGPTQEEVK